MKSLLKTALLLVLPLLLLSCEPADPETLPELLTFKTWRPFQVETATATPDQQENYLEFLAEMRITYREDGTYNINFSEGISPDQNGTWTLQESDSTLFLDQGSPSQRTLKIESIQSISYLYSTVDSIGEVRVFCVAE